MLRWYSRATSVHVVLWALEPRAHLEVQITHKYKQCTVSRLGVVVQNRYNSYGRHLLDKKDTHMFVHICTRTHSYKHTHTHPHHSPTHTRSGGRERSGPIRAITPPSRFSTSPNSCCSLYLDTDWCVCVYMCVCVYVYTFCMCVSVCVNPCVYVRARCRS
jgi:hypothetical protein